MRERFTYDQVKENIRTDPDLKITNTHALLMCRNAAAYLFATYGFEECQRDESPIKRSLQVISFATSRINIMDEKMAEYMGVTIEAMKARRDAAIIKLEEAAGYFRNKPETEEEKAKTVSDIEDEKPSAVGEETALQVTER